MLTRRDLVRFITEKRADGTGGKGTLEWVAQLLTHVSPVVCEGSLYELHRPGVKKPEKLMGITSAMKQFLYDGDRAGWPQRTSMQRHIATLNKQARTRTKVPSLLGASDLRGFMRGSRVHRQIDDFTLLDVASFNRKYPGGLEPLAKALLLAIHENKWWLVKTEVCCYNERGRLATRIDIVCVDEMGILVFLELKTGYADGAFFQPESRISWRSRSPLAGRNLPITPFMLAQVQHAVGVGMLVDNTSLPSRAYRSYIAHVDEVGVVFHELSKQFLYDYVPSLLHYFSEEREAQMIERKRVAKKEREEREREARKRDERAAKRQRTKGGEEGTGPAVKRRRIKSESET